MTRPPTQIGWGPSCWWGWSVTGIAQPRIFAVDRRPDIRRDTAVTGLVRVCWCQPLVSRDGVVRLIDGAEAGTVRGTSTQPATPGARGQGFDAGCPTLRT